MQQVPSKESANSANVRRQEQPDLSAQENTRQTKSSRWGRFRWLLFQRRVPVLLQMSAIECGAACLAMILGYYGRKTTIAEVRERYGVGRDGLTARSIAQAARNYGLRVRALSLPVNDFRFVALPVIVHWEFNHFLVVERWSKEFVDVVDPALGRRHLTAEEFDNGFTGIILTFERGVQFSRKKVKPKITLRTYVIQYMHSAPRILLQIIVVSLFLQVFGLAFPVLTKVVVDQIIPFKMDAILPVLAGGMFILLLAELVTMLLRSALLTYLQTRVDITVSSNFFEHLLTLPHRFFQMRSSGDILERVASNIAIRDLVSSQFVSTLLDGSLVIVYMVILFSQSVSFSLVVLLVGFLESLILLVTYAPIRRLVSRELEARAKSQSYVAEMLAGIETLKAAGVEQRAFQQWSNLYFAQLNVAVRLSYFSATVGAILSTVSGLSPILFLWVGAMQVINGTLQLGTMLALTALAGAFLAPLSSLILSWQQLQIVNSHLQRVADVLEAEPEQDIQQVLAPPRLTGRIELHHVSFQYDPQSPTKILDDIVLHIEPGQKVALVGRTGSGKSTLGKMLIGLCIPTAGQIYYDGIALNTFDYQAVRAQFGTVTQEAHIFNGTVRQNITFNDDTIDMDQVVWAAQIAALHEDIIQWPMNYETYVAEGGSAMSGGQRQRLAIARALAHTPSILLLDEATSSLDVVTERIVEQNLQSLACTQVIIAHRLSTVRNADIILVLDQGRIVERGSHADLLAHNGYYATLIHNQLETGETHP